MDVEQVLVQELKQDEKSRGHSHMASASSHQLHDESDEFGHHRHRRDPAEIPSDEPEGVL